MGVGAVVGGLVVAAAGAGVTRVITATFAFGVTILRHRRTDAPLEIVAMALVGATSIGVLAVGSTRCSSPRDPTMRGRVMALWAVAFLGTTPIGGPIAGWVSETAGGRAGLLMGGVTCIVAAAGAMTYLSQREPSALGGAGIRQT